jgi:ABC-type Fe3+ transport system substrate-binding protein
MPRGTTRTRRIGALLALVLVLAACGAPAAAPSGKPAPAPAAGAAGAASAPPAAAAPAAAAPASKPGDWDAVVAAARQEGTVALLGAPGQGTRRALVDEFEKAYPGIKVEFNSGRMPEQWPRVQAERAAGRYLLDVNVDGTSSTPSTLKPAGAVAPLEPLLMLPEVVDTSAWLENRLWWADSQEPYTVLSFQGNVQLIVTYNKQLVDPSQFRSYWDLLDPKWKGKMVATDVRPGVVGGVSSRFVYQHPELGPTFLERLFGETDLTLSSDQRQLVDWLAQGQFAIGLFISPNSVIDAISQGLPLDFVPGDQWKEGAPIGPSTGGVVVLQPAPHPNAVKVFVNWLLSRDGQLAWQRHMLAPSLRIDIPKDGVYPALVPKPGVRYMDGGTEAFGSLRYEAISEVITRGIEKSRR